jgi:hypothetical protein
MFWSSGKGWHWLLQLTENTPTLASISTSNLIMLHMSKEVQFTTELQPHAKYDKICLMKLVTQDMIFI